LPYFIVSATIDHLDISKR